jgi:osmotically inducible protein OsmC
VAGIDDVTFQGLAADAKKNCPVSKALAAIDIGMKATLKQTERAPVVAVGKD